MTPFKYLIAMLALLVLIPVSTAAAKETTINISPTFVKEHNLYWSNGITVGVQSDYLLWNSLEISASYWSNRMGSGLGNENVLINNYILGGLKLILREGKTITPFLGVRVGHYSYDIDQDDPMEAQFDFLPNSSMVFAPHVGLQINFLERYAIFADANYNVIQDSNLLYPLMTSFGFTYKLGL